MLAPCVPVFKCVGTCDGGCIGTSSHSKNDSTLQLKKNVILVHDEKNCTWPDNLPDDLRQENWGITDVDLGFEENSIHMR